jgi:hypothetical protein
MEVVAHQTVSIVNAIRSAGFPVVIILYPHSIESINELPAILFVLKDILMINATHHHVKYPCT